MAYVVKSLVRPADYGNVEECNAAFAPIVTAINECGLLDFQATVNIVAVNVWVNYYKFKLHPNKGLRVVSKYDNFTRANNYYLDLFDWTEGLDIYNGDPPLQNKISIFSIGPNDFGILQCLYNPGVALNVYHLNVFYVKSVEDDSKQDLVALYCIDLRMINQMRQYIEFLSNLRCNYVLDYNNASGGDQIICGTYISFSNQFYSDKVYTGTNKGDHGLRVAQKYRMYNISDGRAEVVYYMYPVLYREG